MNARFVRYGIVLGVLAATTLPVSAAVVPEGDVIQVGAATRGRQFDPVAAFAADGSSVVAWSNTHGGIVAQQYDAAGNAIDGNLTLVANDPPPPLPFEGELHFRRDPALVAVTGGYLLFYTEELAFVRSTPFLEQRRVLSQDVMVQRFDDELEAVGSPVRASQGRGGLQRDPVALALGGGAVVVWGEHRGAGDEQRHDLVARLVDASGAVASAAVTVDEDDGAASAAEILAAAGGGFYVAWESGDGSKLGTFARRFGADGSPQGAAFRLNGVAERSQRRPALASRPSGGLLAIWEGDTGEERRRAIYGRFLDADGNPAGSDFTVSQGLTYAQLAPAVTALGDGGFLVTWRSYLDGTGYGIVAVELDASGAPTSAETWINSRKIYKTAHNTIAPAGGGEFLVAWEAFVRNSQVVFARRVRVD